MKVEVNFRQDDVVLCLSLPPHLSLVPAVKLMWLCNKNVWQKKKKFSILELYFFQLEFRQIIWLTTVTGALSASKQVHEVPTSVLCNLLENIKKISNTPNPPGINKLNHWNNNFRLSSLSAEKLFI